MDWRWRAHWGWTAEHQGHLLTIKAYRRGDGHGWTYVPRMDGSAATSPAVAYLTLAEAKRAAEAQAKGTR